ncbi:MAG: hypothetical protein B7Z57_11645 [Acidiphilium sp. 37-60-79]|nr:MAG: hypothetical protein B7Z57_11645 [Acidiphilium sp. 37-60-79]OZB40868.1 MAG: hypothetical protein B7X48_03315 [Acidiphilium sp. 34-60-192]
MALGVVSIIDEDDGAQPLGDGVPSVVVADEDEGDGSEKLPEGLVAAGDEYQLVLRRAVVLNFKSTSGAVREERIERLPLRRLTGADMRAMMSSARQDGSLLLLERAVTLPERRVVLVLDRMDAADLMRAMACIAFLSGSSPPTGR